MRSTLKECFEVLEQELPGTTLAEMRSGTLDDMILYHHGVGTWIRNRWRSGDPLPQELGSLLPMHLDDLSGLVLDTFWCHLHGLPVRIEEHVARREAFMQGLMQPRWSSSQEKLVANAAAPKTDQALVEAEPQLVVDGSDDGDDA